jgi:hypothetical protein
MFTIFSSITRHKKKLDRAQKRQRKNQEKQNRQQKEKHNLTTTNTEQAEMTKVGNTPGFQ